MHASLCSACAQCPQLGDREAPRHHGEWTARVGMVSRDERRILMSATDTTMKHLRIGDLTSRLPIVQGGMGVGVSLAGLASAVASEGGIGVIASVGIGSHEPDLETHFLEANLRVLKQEIRKARQKTDGILGVNIMVALTDYAEHVKTAIAENIDILFSGAGLPLNLPEYATDGQRTKLVPIVSSGRAAEIICRRWATRYGRLPDAVVVEGPLAGGHLGFRKEQINDPHYALERLVPEVLAAVAPFAATAARPIPVIAAGGIYTGADIRRFLHLGAAAVQMGTRFVATHECDVAPEFKAAYLTCAKDDVMIVNSPVGMPGRAIRNAFLDDIRCGKRKPFRCPYRCLRTCDVKNSPYCIASALVNAQHGNLASGFAFAGANAWRTTEIVSVRELLDSLVEEYLAASAAAGPGNQTAARSRRQHRASLVASLPG